MFQSSHIFIYIESNMSFITADWISHKCRAREFQPVHVESKDKSDLHRPGVWTGANEKHLYAEHLKVLLNNDSLDVYRHLCGAHAKKDFATLLEQMKVYRKEIKPAETPFQAPKVTHGGKSEGKKDDLVMTLQMVHYWATLNRKSERYRLMAHNYGWAASESF